MCGENLPHFHSFSTSNSFHSATQMHCNVCTFQQNCCIAPYHPEIKQPSWLTAMKAFQIAQGELLDMVVRKAAIKRRGHSIIFTRYNKQ